MKFKLLGIIYLVLLISCKEKEHLQLSGIYHNEYLDRYIIFQENGSYYKYDGTHGYIENAQMGFEGEGINEPKNYYIKAIL